MTEEISDLKLTFPTRISLRIQWCKFQIDQNNIHQVTPNFTILDEEKLQSKKKKIIKALQRR